MSVSELKNTIYSLITMREIKKKWLETLCSRDFAMVADRAYENGFDKNITSVATYLAKRELFDNK